MLAALFSRSPDSLFRLGALSFLAVLALYSAYHELDGAFRSTFRRLRLKHLWSPRMREVRDAISPVSLVGLGLGLAGINLLLFLGPALTALLANVALRLGAPSAAGLCVLLGAATAYFVKRGPVFDLAKAEERRREALQQGLSATELEARKGAVSNHFAGRMAELSRRSFVFRRWYEYYFRRSIQPWFDERRDEVQAIVLRQLMRDFELVYILWAFNDWRFEDALSDHFYNINQAQAFAVLNAMLECENMNPFVVGAVLERTRRAAEDKREGHRSMFRYKVRREVVAKGHGGQSELVRVLDESHFGMHLEVPIDFARGSVISVRPNQRLVRGVVLPTSHERSSDPELARLRVNFVSPLDWSELRWGCREIQDRSVAVGHPAKA